MAFNEQPIKIPQKKDPKKKKIYEFLKDIEQYPDSGIVARYKRLGLSVRQGQKITNRALEGRFIEEAIESTDKGRIK